MGNGNASRQQGQPGRASGARAGGRALTGRRLAWALAPGLLFGAACDRLDKMAHHPSLAPQHALTLRTSASPLERLRLQVAGERNLAEVALGLGTTADQIVKDNALLPGSSLVDGQTLVVQTRPEALAGYVERRTAAARAREEARLAAQRAREAAAAQAAMERIQKRRAERMAEREARRKAREARRAGRGAAHAP